ncbi:MAG TPA: hypothetical protein V6D50_12260 [Chroococcales cyanobacterium]
MKQLVVFFRNCFSASLFGESRSRYSSSKARLGVERYPNRALLLLANT